MQFQLINLFIEAKIRENFCYVRLLPEVKPTVKIGVLLLEDTFLEPFLPRLIIVHRPCGQTKNYN